jgi:hypothetical protein
MLSVFVHLIWNARKAGAKPEEAEASREELSFPVKQRDEKAETNITKRRSLSLDFLFSSSR